MLNLFTTVYAEAAATTAQQPTTAEMLTSFIPFILIFVVMYFILIRPQKKKEKELKAKIEKMKVGDNVVTIGGICGKVAKIKDNFVFVETGHLGTQDAKSTIKFEKGAIRDIESKIEA